MTETVFHDCAKVPADICAASRVAHLGKPRRSGERGYSLLEVLIVLTIIALVAALVGPRLMAQLDRSKVTAARVQTRALAAALETMRLDIGRYPESEEGLELLMRDRDAAGDGWQGPYLDSDLPLDPWGRPYVYTAPDALGADMMQGGSGARPRIASLGADGREGGSGLDADIVVGDGP